MTLLPAQLVSSLAAAAAKKVFGDPILTLDVSVYDTIASTFTFYTNGVQAAQILLDSAPPAYLTTSHLGAWLGLDGNLYRYLDGQIDEFAVYSSALTPDRIAAHYQAGLDVGVLSVDASTPGLAPAHSSADHQTNSLSLSSVLRAGVGATFNAKVSNTGDANSLISSVAGSDMVFSDLASGTPHLSASFDVAGPTTFGTPAATTYRIATDAGAVNIVVNPLVYGPALSGSVSGNGDAGLVFLGQSGNLQFNAQNSSSGASVPQAAPSVYELSILGMTIDGADAVRSYHATLLVTTDVNAAPGTPGAIFGYSLTGTGGVAPAIQITQQPADAQGQPGDTVTFSVAANAVGTASPLTFQWQRNDFAISYATNSTYTTSPLSLADNGARFSCVLAAGTLSVQSATATLTVISPVPPHLTAQTVQGGALQLSWPGNGWVLEHNPGLTNPAAWTTVPGGDSSPVIISPTTTLDFFRLREQ